MNPIIPWDEWVKKIQPHYPAGKRGRPPRGIEVMLRMYLLQIWFNLSDAGLEDAIYDSYAFQRFIGINFLEEQVPDATTHLKFRHLLEKHDLGKALFDDISAQLDKAGLIMHGGTIVDATIIHSTPSTKNKTGERDPEMHQTKKGNQWYHGMKVHIGVDAGTGFVHTIICFFDRIIAHTPPHQSFTRQRRTSSLTRTPHRTSHSGNMSQKWTNFYIFIVLPNCRFYNEFLPWLEEAHHYLTTFHTIRFPVNYLPR